MSDIEVEFRGTTIESISVPVKSPETALGWFDPIQTTASAFPGLVTDTTRVSKIDAATQNWVSYLVSTGITDFNVEQGMGLMVNVSSDSTWNYP